MTSRGLTVALAVVVLLAGCSLPFGDGSAPDSTPSATPEETETRTPTPKPGPHAVGVDEEGFTDVSALLSVHTRELNRTGFVAVGSGRTTVLRSGFLINVTRDGRTVVAAGSDRYYELRRTDAGLVVRTVERYANGSVEVQRREEDGDVSYGEGPVRSAAVLANVEFLEPLLVGGDFRVTEVRNDSSPAIVVLRANESANETALRSALPADGERVRSYNATALVDSDGRVRYLNASIGFVIGGENRTHRVTFNLTRVGATNVSTPDWVDEPDETASPTVTDATPTPSDATPTPSDADSTSLGGTLLPLDVAHWSRFVVSTRG